MKYLIGLALIAAILAVGCASQASTSNASSGLSRRGSSIAPASSAQTTTSAPTTRTATKEIIYAPWQSDGRLANFEVTATASGTCWEGSLAASGRSDAWRCSAGNLVLDPCFSNALQPTAPQLVCPDSLSAGTLFNLTAPRDPRYVNKDVPGVQPWAMALTTGQLCNVITGAAGAVGRLRINYACTGGLFLYGDPDRTTTPWRIFSAKQGNPTLEQVDIATVYN
jgi:eukaryotic-like serine/threonine-protein kinase